MARAFFARSRGQSKRQAPHRRTTSSARVVVRRNSKASHAYLLSPINSFASAITAAVACCWSKGSAINLTKLCWHNQQHHQPHHKPHATGWCCWALLPSHCHLYFTASTQIFLLRVFWLVFFSVFWKQGQPTCIYTQGFELLMTVWLSY